MADDFDYNLPPDRIAQTPMLPRDRAKLLRLSRTSGDVSHHIFAELADLIPPDALLVMNETRVEPRRFYAKKAVTGGRVELLLLDDKGDFRWICMVRPGLQQGQKLVLVDQADHPVAVQAEVASVLADGTCLITFDQDPKQLWGSIGRLPVPPYVKNYEGDPELYQTVYAHNSGSMAAPTAGLHFTPELLDRLRMRGIQTEYITLHVSRDTAFPVSRDEPLDKITIHGEVVRVAPDVAIRINQAKVMGRPIIAVGTTTVRTLEACARLSEGKEVIPYTGVVDLFIKPGHDFRVIDGMITNFHVPRSTLMMLVSAFAGRERILGVYTEALRSDYRFLSFGDAMLIL